MSTSRDFGRPVDLANPVGLVALLFSKPDQYAAIWLPERMNAYSDLPFVEHKTAILCGWERGFRLFKAANMV